jgi:serine/alanine adding enzyme
MIRLYDPGLELACREFLDRCPQANYCHDPAWADVIREAYGKEAFTYVRTDPITGEVKGMAPACHLASTAFGRSLVCLPYLDYGGILAADAETEDLLRDKLVAEAQSRRAQLEIRSRDPLCGLPAPQDEKVAMILPLMEDTFLPEDGDWSAVSEDAFAAPLTSEDYWNSLDPKVRNQVRKSVKSGVTVMWGREERLDDFYEVFCVNMRDLGSPTHAKGFFEAVLKHFPGAQIGTAHREGKCIGGLFRILWKDELAIPWASTLKEERIHCPNNALYWQSLLYAFEQGCRRVDFGRSTRDEGTYRFKKQWGVQELPLYRYQFDEKGHFLERSWHVSQGKLGWTRNVWAKLPLKLANSLGPMLRGSISA